MSTPRDGGGGQRPSAVTELARGLERIGDPAPPSTAALERARALGLSHAWVGYFDWHARLRAKQIRLERLALAMDEGIPFSSAVFSLDHTDAPMTGTRLADPAGGYGDALLRALPETAREPPALLGGGLLLLGELIDARYRPLCPRALLGSELERLAGLGLQAHGAFEIECHLFEETTTSLAGKTPAALRPAPVLGRMYAFAEHGDAPALLADLARACEAMQVPLETLHAEYAALLEAALRPATGVALADAAALYRTGARAVAASHGLMASFMARPGPDARAAGAHLNLSLHDAQTGQAAFAGSDGAGGANATLRHFLGGLQHYTPELTLLHCPNLNSYKRLAPGLLAPVTNTWGWDNKTTAYRVVRQSTPGAVRVELRLPGADANPYLALLGAVAAGRRGLEECLEPAAACTGSGWDAPEPPAGGFPRALEAAVQRFEASALAHEALGEAFVSCYAETRRWQIDQLARTVTDWELRTFAEGA